jgi:hypothetical protein
VKLLEETDRSRVLEEVARRIKSGTTYREVLAALLLAGVRNIQPRPVGFKFHAVLVVNSAHLASLSSPEGERWLPIFWAIDAFKASQARDVAEGDWTMGPVDEKAVPPRHRARQALIDALEQWDEPAADAAIVGMTRAAGANEIFDVLCKYGARDFREIGHKAIYVANSFRTLETIGWHHAEPVLRSLVYAIVDTMKQDPVKSDLPADRPWRRNLEAMKKVPAGWQDGKVDADATAQMLKAIRDGATEQAGELAVNLISKGVSAASLFDAFHAGSGELMMRAPGILSLHATTFTNAVHYAFNRCGDEETRKLLVLQNAAFLPLFRGNSKDKGIHVDTLEPVAPENKEGAVEEIFALVSKDKLLAARKMVGYLQGGGSAKALADAGRRMIFLKGRDSHDYKFSSAVFEDYLGMNGGWGDRFLAASAFYLKGAGDKDNELIKRVRGAFD